MKPPKIVNQRLYFSAPSRSGSSFLETCLNCLKNVIIVNEPLNSYRIDNRAIIDSVYQSIITDLKNGFVKQRLDRKGEEVTDTFPNEEISWQKQPAVYLPKITIGIKKSFPSLGNKDYHRLFLEKWPSFVNWFTQKRNGKVLTIIRNPIYTLFSWKTTFDALRSDATTQCQAWNRIASAMLKTQKQSCLVRYEDVIKNPTSETKKIASFLEIEFIKTKNFPQVKPNTNTLAYYLKNRNLPAYSVIKDVETIVKICSPVAAELGYNLERDKKTLFSPRRH